MEIKWLGTAGFEFKTRDQVFYVDPFVSRNHKTLLKQNLAGLEIRKGARIFISHGHFDHIRDIPEIARQAGAKIYCSSGVAKSLQDHGVNPGQIQPILADKKNFKFQTYAARAFFSRHLRFDAKLLFSTLLRVKAGLFPLLPLLTGFPRGQVLAWQFLIENRIVLFLGSLGSPRAGPGKMGNRPVDVLLIPLQGHSDICRMGLDHVRAFRPKTVIPHHYDDSFPPISRAVDITPFVEGVKKECRQTRVMVLKMNEPVEF
jgi:L-ascorbate metabolism protein UlaG (beta-lactamase superfamily)